MVPTSVQRGSARTSEGRFPNALPGRLVALFCVFVTLFEPALCAAQGEARLSARDHFERGVAASRQGDLPSALEHFEKAYAQSPNQIVLYNLGQTYSALGRAAEATRALRRYLEGDSPPDDAKRRAQVEELLRFNERRVGSLVVTLDPAESSLAVDGTPADRDASGKIVLTAGRHVVTAEHAGYRPAMLRVDVRAGEEIRVRLSPEPLRVEAAAPGAFVEIACRVPDVSVFVDDVSVGRTPLAHLVAVSLGEHEVRFSRQGYRGAVEKLSARAEARARTSCALDVDPTLPSAERGTLRVVTTVEKARAFVDGEPLADARVPAGAHDIEVRAPGFVTWRRAVEVPVGKQKDVIVTLAPTAEREREERARTRRTVAYATGGTGILLGGLSIGLYVTNRGRYDEWRSDAHELSNELANGEASADHSKRAADLQERAADIQRTDDIALGAGILGGALIAVSAGLLLFGDD